MSYYRTDYEFYICNHILYENYVSLSVYPPSGTSSSYMDKNVMLSDEELNLLIIGLHYVSKGIYNFYTTTYTPWNEAKELKENLRIKLKRAFLNV